MKVEYINRFIEGVYDLMRTMLSAQAKKGTASVAKASSSTRHSWR